MTPIEKVRAALSDEELTAFLQKPCNKKCIYFCCQTCTKKCNGSVIKQEAER